MYNVGKAKYVINFSDGKKKCVDGSPFFDVKLLKSKKDVSEFVKKLKAEGYKEESL